MNKYANEHNTARLSARINSCFNLSTETHQVLYVLNRFTNNIALSNQGTNQRRMEWPHTGALSTVTPNFNSVTLL